MTHSRKIGSKIHDDGKALIRKVKQFAADAFSPAGYTAFAAA